MGLNREQALAVSHKDGPMLVLAGPGSGKTHTLIERIVHLIEDEHVRPEEILTITFSKKAAEEMQERFEKRIGDHFYPVSFGTFHAIFFHILKQHYNYSSDSILTPKLKFKYLSSVCEDMENKDAFNEAFLSDFINKMSLYNSMTLDVEDRLRVLNITGDEAKAFIDIKSAYEELIKKEGKLDFDDMLYMCKELLSNNEAVRERWQNRYRYFLVDEFQDINDVQYDVLNLLAGENKNIFAVGDDDQSIYGFRGSKPELMRKFMEENSNCQVVNLSKNYRCPKVVIDSAAKLINNNKLRIDKFQTAEKVDKDIGEVHTMTFESVIEESEYVISKIKENITDKGNVRSTAVLYRTAQCANYLEERLIVEGIPYDRKNEKSDFYDMEFVKDIIAYLRIASCNKLDRISRSDLYRIINRPERNLTREGIKDNPYPDDLCNCFSKYPSKTIIWNRFVSDIKVIGKYTPFLAINYVLKAIKYDEYMRKMYYSKGKDKAFVDELLDELIERSRQFETIKDWLIYIDAIKESKNDISTSDTRYRSKKFDPNSKKGKVVMQTVHASKGLEYDNVFIIGLTEGIFPHNKADSVEAMEEERRLMYVAMTRARKNLYIIGRGDYAHGKHVSRFVGELKG